MTSFDCEEAIFQTARAGAKAFLTKGADPQEIREAVRRVAKGATFLPSEIGLKLAKSVSSPRLSKREMEVLENLAEGERNREIAHALDIGEGTIKYHVKSILRKLNVIGRAEAIAVASKRGIIQVPTQHLRTDSIVPVVKVERSSHQWSFTNANRMSITRPQTKVVV
jgi:two-component system NarL family response regulator